MKPSKRTLGRTGLQVSEISLGGYFFPSMDRYKDYEAVIARALESGINLIDTAPGYKESEDVMGKALAGGRREKIVLSSKYYPYGNEDKLNLSGDSLVATVEKSLKRMGTDRLDILHLHWVHNAEDIKALMESGVADSLRKLKEQGKVLHFAVSEASELDGEHAMLEAALPGKFFESIMVTYNILLPNAALRVLPLAKETSTGVLVMMPLNQPQAGKSGLISRENALENLDHLLNEGAVPDSPAYRDKGIFDFLPGIPGANFAQAALRFTLDHPAVTSSVVGTTSLKHLDDNIAVSGMPQLPPQAHARVAELFGKVVKHVK